MINETETNVESELDVAYGSVCVSDLMFALDCAAEFLELREFGGDDPEVQERADKEGARRIRRMAKRLHKQNIEDSHAKQ